MGFPTSVEKRGGPKASAVGKAMVCLDQKKYLVKEKNINTKIDLYRKGTGEGARIKRGKLLNGNL